MKEAGLCVYCDGAWRPKLGRGAWAFVVYRDGVEIHAAHGSQKETTNNEMELQAVLSALEWIEANVREPVRLLSDSRYAVGGCNSWRHKWKRNGWRRLVGRYAPEIKSRPLWEDLDAALGRVDRVQIGWVRGHSGVPGNMRADRLAAIGLRKTEEGTRT